MKKILPFMLLFLPLAVSAEVYVVDVQKVLLQSKSGKQAKSQLEDKFEKSKAKLEKQRKEVQALQEDLKKQSALLSEEALQKKLAGLRKKEREVGTSYQKYQNEFTQENNAKLGAMMKALSEVVTELAEEKDLPMILDKNQRIVLFANDDKDLTDEVLKRFNSKKIKF